MTCFTWFMWFASRFSSCRFPIRSLEILIFFGFIAFDTTNFILSKRPFSHVWKQKKQMNLININTDISEYCLTCIFDECTEYKKDTDNDPSFHSGQTLSFWYVTGMTRNTNSFFASSFFSQTLAQYFKYASFELFSVPKKGYFSFPLWKLISLSFH